MEFMKTITMRVVRVAVFGVLVLLLLFAPVALTSPALPLVLSAAWNFLWPDHLSVAEVCGRWGERPLDVTAFRSAEDDESTRAAMACSLLRNQQDYVGMHRLEILRLFGYSSGYYYTDMTPAYLIEDAKTKARDSWQIVFRIDRDRKVSEIFVRKVCC